MRPRRIVLLGFMASGKTEVGRGLARRLAWRHVDFDREIERETGCSVDEIFGTRGEAAFRRLESAITPKLLRLRRAVLSTGGGWITNPGLFASRPADTLTVWLKVSADEVERRLEAAHDQPDRPLLRAGAQPGGISRRSRIEELLARREPLYREADVAVDTDGLSVGEVVESIEKIVRGGGTAGPPLNPGIEHGT